jgi:hypothetical protein
MSGTDVVRILTRVALPPGEPSKRIAKELADVIVCEAKWIDPRKYPKQFQGRVSRTSSLVEGREGLEAMIGTRVGVGAEARGQYLAIAGAEMGGRFQYRKNIEYWSVSTHATLELPSHRDIVTRLMRLVRSPLACANIDDQTLSSPIESEEYPFGLPYPRWRMWFGKEYADFLGRDKLASSPALLKEDLGDIFFVQLFDDPFRWNEPAGREVAQKFMDYLGRDCFFDPVDPERKRRAPNFDHLR